MLLTLDLHAIGLVYMGKRPHRMATGVLNLDELDKAPLELQLHPMMGYAATAYRVFLREPENHALPGWRICKADLVIDAWSCTPGPTPLSWYQDEPTDWPTGLARFQQDYQAESDGRHGVDWIPGPQWVLAVRRSS